MHYTTTSQVLMFYYFNRTCDILVSINSSCIYLFIFLLKEHGRFEFMKIKIDFVSMSLALRNGLHGDDNNGGNAQRCRRVQTKQSTISLL